MIRKLRPGTRGFSFAAILRPALPIDQIQDMPRMADMAEIGRAHLSQIENGAVAARIDTLYAIAQALELSLSEMLKGL